MQIISCKGELHTRVFFFHLPKYCRSRCSTTYRMQTVENMLFDAVEILLIFIFRGTVFEIQCIRLEGQKTDAALH